MNPYVFDQGWQKERDRLAGIEFLFDSYSTQRLADLGVSEGWHCLDVGCGAGGVALWLAGQVGSLSYDRRLLGTAADGSTFSIHLVIHINVPTSSVAPLNLFAIGQC